MSSSRLTPLLTLLVNEWTTLLNKIIPSYSLIYLQAYIPQDIEDLIKLGLKSPSDTYDWTGIVLSDPDLNIVSFECSSTDKNFKEMLIEIVQDIQIQAKQERIDIKELSLTYFKQDGEGVNEKIKQMTDWLAKQGFSIIYGKILKGNAVGIQIEKTTGSLSMNIISTINLDENQLNYDIVQREKAIFEEKGKFKFFQIEFY